LSAHTKYEELCALATSGQLTDAEARSLHTHLRDCADCSRFLSGARAVSDAMIPRILPLPAGEFNVPEGIRERFLKRASSHGLQIDPGEPIAGSNTATSIESEVAGPRSSSRVTSRHLWFQLLNNWQPVVGVALACAVCFALGTKVPWHDVMPVATTSARSTPVSPVPSVRASLSAVDTDALLGRIRELTKERDSLAQEHAQLVSEQEAMAKAKKDNELALKAQTTALQSDAAHDHESLAQQGVALRDRALALESELNTLQKKQSETEAMLAAQENTTRQYFSQVGELKRQLAADSHIPAINNDEVRSLVTARNLHIIDVYDSDGMGKRQHAFGRIFYVEGKSLVFYAYDLGKAHREERVAFHVWGIHDDKETTISLGILHDQDPKEQRWALVYDDSKVLSKINSVFVTMEPNNRNVTSPTGKVVLYAFLGENPNHP
jgi:hypothetical protein